MFRNTSLALAVLLGLGTTAALAQNYDPTPEHVYNYGPTAQATQGTTHAPARHMRHQSHKQAPAKHSGKPATQPPM